jgi:photosystem II stability/assembly factor-like uncharacterized protein
MRATPSAWISCAAFLCCYLASAAAAAHGRTPATFGVSVDPGNPNRLWVQSTQGLLLSSDGGCTWHWICEEAFSAGGGAHRALAATNGGLLAGVVGGLFATEADACSWRHEFIEQSVVDIDVDPADPRRVLMLSSTYAGGVPPVYTNRLWRSNDAGRTWSQLGPDLATDVSGVSLAVAPSDPTKIYVTAFAYTAQSTLQTVLLRSEDGAASFERTALAAVESGHVPYLAAVAPADPRKLYLRVLGPKLDRFVVSRVLHSSNGGNTWSKIYEAPADVLALLLSTDGKQLFIGVGDPLEPEERPVDSSALGLYVASTSDHQFTRRRAGHVGCLSWSERGMYICTREPSEGADLGMSTELAISPDEGTTFEPVLHLAGIQGPLACSAQSIVTRTCTSAIWKDVCMATQRCVFPTGEPLPHRAPEHCRATARSEEGASCGCRATGTRGTQTAWLPILSLAAWLAFARRRVGSHR